MLIINVNIISKDKRCLVSFEINSGIMQMITVTHSRGTHALLHQPINIRSAVSRMNRSDWTNLLMYDTAVVNFSLIVNILYAYARII